MPIASDILLDWAAQEDYSLSEVGRIRAQDGKFYFEVSAENDGHRVCRRITRLVCIGSQIQVRHMGNAD